MGPAVCCCRCRVMGKDAGVPQGLRAVSIRNAVDGIFSSLLRAETGGGGGHWQRRGCGVCCEVEPKGGIYKAKLHASDTW